MMMRQIERAVLVARAGGTALAAGLLLLPMAAAADPVPAGDGPAAVIQEAPSGQAPRQGEVVANGTPAAAADAGTQASPGVVTLEQIRAGMEEADKRREALMRPDPAVAGSAARQELIERWGVEVYGLRQAANGYMLDFRFRVLDADKALPLFDSRIQPFLLTEGTNIKLPVPVGAKVGAFRTTNRGKNIKAGKDYYMMFANPDSYVRPGQKVSVVIGAFRADSLTVR